MSGLEQEAGIIVRLVVCLSEHNLLPTQIIEMVRTIAPDRWIFVPCAFIHSKDLADMVKWLAEKEKADEVFVLSSVPVKTVQHFLGETKTWDNPKVKLLKLGSKGFEEVSSNGPCRL